MKGITLFFKDGWNWAGLTGFGTSYFSAVQDNHLGLIGGLIFGVVAIYKSFEQIKTEKSKQQTERKKQELLSKQINEES